MGVFTEQDATLYLGARLYLINFQCPCCERVRLDHRFAFHLVEALSRVGMEVRIVSGYRCDAYNDVVGGAKNSLHKTGNAADLVHPVADQFKLACAMAPWFKTLYNPDNECVHVQLGRAGLYIKMDGEYYNIGVHAKALRLDV